MKIFPRQGGVCLTTFVHRGRQNPQKRNKFLVAALRKTPKLSNIILHLYFMRTFILDILWAAGRKHLFYSDYMGIVKAQRLASLVIDLAWQNDSDLSKPLRLLQFMDISVKPVFCKLKDKLGHIFVICI